VITASAEDELDRTAITGQPAKILLVDDEPFNLELLAQELEDFGFGLQTATNGREALDLVQQEPPDMVFLDLMMPVMDGFEVLERLQADEAWRSIPVVIVSASDDLDNVVRGIEMGAVDFLPKPFEPAILHARLRAGLEKKRLADLEQLYLRSLERELEIGREIQADFLPKRIPQPKGWQLTAHFQAAREVAGDFYDVFQVGPGKLALLLGDVTDKGVGSALYMALYRSLLRATLMYDRLTGEGDVVACEAPEDCLERTMKLVNRYICQSHESAMLATVFLGILDTANGQLWYASAGHDSPFVLKEGEVKAEIQPTGPVIGVIEEAVYRVRTLALAPGDCLVLYSDGITDALNRLGDMFGLERFVSKLEGQASTPAEILDRVVTALGDHVGEADQYDDVSLLLVRREP
jgi:serine phosphatase RsbU (regulator of sigma subunit)